MFNNDLYMKLRYNAHVCKRCGLTAEADKLTAEADKIMQDYIAELDKQAGIARD